MFKYLKHSMSREGIESLTWLNKLTLTVHRGDGLCRQLSLLQGGQLLHSRHLLKDLLRDMRGLCRVGKQLKLKGTKAISYK